MHAVVDVHPAIASGVRSESSDGERELAFSAACSRHPDALAFVCVRPTTIAHERDCALAALYPGTTLGEDAAPGLGDVFAGGDGCFDGGEVLVDWIGGRASGRRHADREIR